MSEIEVRMLSAFKEEPTWMNNLRLANLSTYETLPQPDIEKVNFHRWNLTDDVINAEYGEELINRDRKSVV